jgi:hypothetical protein
VAAACGSRSDLSAIPSRLPVVQAFVIPECGYGPGREIAYAVDAGDTCGEAIASHVGTWMHFGLSSLPVVPGTYVIGNPGNSPNPSWAYECVRNSTAQTCDAATGSLTVTEFSDTARTAAGSYTLAFSSGVVSASFEATICDNPCP